MIKKLVTSLLIAAAVISINPIGASAAWKQDNTGWWNTEDSGYSIGWKQIDGSWYYFDNNGYMKTGDLSIEGKTYQFGSDGKWIGSTSTASSAPSDEKLKATSDCSWFTENGNTYFKTTGLYNAGGVWNIDGKTYYFDNNGVMQKGEAVLNDGLKYLFGEDGKLIKCVSNENATFYTVYAAATYSSTQNKGVTLDNKFQVYNIASTEGWLSGANIPADQNFEGNTLKTLANRTIFISSISPKSIENSGTVVPNLVVQSTSTNSDVAFCGVELNNVGGTHVIINPAVITKNPGKTTITIDVNGTKTSFDVVVTK